MVKLYVDLIKKGLRTLADVPEKWRKAVEDALKEESDK